MFLRKQWNEPSRADFYAMKIAFHLIGKKQMAWKDLVIHFPTDPVAPKKKMSEADLLAYEKAAMIARVGGNVQVVTLTREEAGLDDAIPFEQEVPDDGRD